MTPDRFDKLKRVLNRRQPDLTILTENVHKSHNLSAVLRTCDAVGIFEAHAVSADGAVARHHMISGGASKWVPLRVHPSLPSACDFLRELEFRILAAHFSAQAVDFRAEDYTRPTAILLGSELEGVSGQAAALADGHIVIPMHGMVASLNVSVAAAVILFEAQRQRQKVGLYEESRLDQAVYARTLFEWAYPEVAEICRRKREPYPDLDENGYLVTDPARRS